MKFYYFYKITNQINGKFYFGVHSTDNLEDGYMGSGVALKRAYSKHGIENFTKEILTFFANADEMYAFEEQQVNDGLVADPNCYNMVIGGRGHKVTSQMSELAKKVNSTEEELEKKRLAIRRYWTTGDVAEKKRKASEGSKKYWRTGDVEAKHKHQSEIQRESYRRDPERHRKLAEALNRRWHGEKGAENRKKLGETLRNSEKHKEMARRFRESGISAGYKNFDFVKRWKPVYEGNMAEICELLKFSNLPDQFIVSKMFGLPIKVYRLIAYYQSLGALPASVGSERHNRFLRLEDTNGKGHKDGGSIKTIFTRETKYDFMFVYPEFFAQFARMREIEKNDEISDSMVYNRSDYATEIPNFKQVLEYFSEMGVALHIHQVTVRVWKTVTGKTFTVPAVKTKFTVDYKHHSKILIDKEFNRYEIDDDGMPFPTGRFELEIDGKKYPLRCKGQGD